MAIVADYVDASRDCCVLRCGDCRVGVLVHICIDLSILWYLSVIFDLDDGCSIAGMAAFELNL